MLVKFALLVATALQMSHCTRRDESNRTVWINPSNFHCASVAQDADQQWVARPKVDPPQTFKTRQEAAAWIETNYCLVDKK